MLNKNNMQTGILLGLILPVLSVLVFELVMNNAFIIVRRGVPYFFVIGANLILLRIFAGRKQEKTAQGVMIVTFIFMVLVYFLRYR